MVKKQMLVPEWALIDVCPVVVKVNPKVNAPQPAAQQKLEGTPRRKSPLGKERGKGVVPPAAS